MTCRDAIQADVICGRLETEGIHCIITQRSDISYLSTYLEPYSTYIQVEDGMYDAALCVLGMEAGERVMCPLCHGSDTHETGSPHGKKEHFWQRWWRMIFHSSRRYFVCHDCHRDFYTE